MKRRPVRTLSRSDRHELTALVREAATGLDPAACNRLLQLHHDDTANREQERRTAGGAQHQLHKARAQLRALEAELAAAHAPEETTE